VRPGRMLPHATVPPTAPASATPCMTLSFVMSDG
jgi:hypothetical protein